MFAFLQTPEKVSAGAEKQLPSTVVAWNKQNDLLLVGRVDGSLLLRNLESRTRLQARISGKIQTGLETLKTEDQGLANHKLEIRNIAWNPKYDVVATGDSGGIVTVWKLDEKTAIWENSMATRAVQVAVLGMEWTKDGECIGIVYENGSVMVGKIDGMKMWSVELKHARIPAWSPDGAVLLVGTYLGQIFIYDKGSNNVGLVALTRKPEDKPSESPLIDIKWCPALLGEGFASVTPALAVAFEDGKCFMLRGEDDSNPTAFTVPMTVSCIDWSSDGKLLVVGGRSRKTVAKPESGAQIMIYSPFVRQEYVMRFESKSLSGLSWDSFGGKIAVILDGTVNFLTIKHPLKFCFFENILAYSCAKEDKQDALLVLYNCKTERRVTVKHYPGQRVLCLASGTDFCAAGTKVMKENSQYNIYIMNETGATANVTSSSIEPIFLTANDNQVIAASREVMLVWNCRQGGTAADRWESNERYFHIDDAHGFIDIKVKRMRVHEVSADPICAISCSKDVLVVSRESGNVVRYGLPQMSWEREYAAILPKSKKLGLNSDSSRLLLMNNDGQCCMYVLSETKLSKDAPPVKDVKLNLERHDIWDFEWAADDVEMFVVAHKSTAVVYRNHDPEDPIANEGYFCQFKNLEICVALVDEFARSATPTEPPTQSTKVLRVKALRETHYLMETSTLAEAQRFVDTHPHPVLWNLIADKALQRMQLDMAEVCYIHGENYRGLQFIGRLRRHKSDRVRQAEISAHFGDLYQAEQQFTSANRVDLAYDMRRIAGDWFRLKEMAQEDQNDDVLRSSYEGLGKYYYDRQSWEESVRNFDYAHDYAALYKCYMLSGDVGKLEELAEVLPTAHPLLVDIGQLLGRYGHSKAASKILRKADRFELAVQTCLNNHDYPTAAEIARTVDLEGYTPDTVAGLMNSAIEQQITSQKGSQALWGASKLYYNAGSFLKSAKCLFQILSLESKETQVDYLRLKKLSVLAASAVEEGKKGSGRKGAGDKRMFLEEDTESADYAFLDDPWHQAEAYNLMILAQTFYAKADYPRALRAAGTLSLYMDVLDPVQIFSVIALAGTCLKRWDIVNETIMRLVSMDTTPQLIIDEMERFADDLFTKFSPNDVDKDSPLPSPMCMKCKEQIPIWDVRCQNCGTKYPLCMATGSPVTESEVWQCDFCHHHCSASAILKRRVCPLCHVARR